MARMSLGSQGFLKTSYITCSLQENSNIYDFGLTPSEINRLKKLDQGENGRIFNFLFWKGVENHPEYPYKFLTLAADKK